MAEKSEQGIDHTITRNIPRLAKYGVLTVRPGYEVTGHQLTGRRAIVATVYTKKPLAELAPSEKLPDRIDGVPVDVREARPYQRLRAADPLAAELSQRYSRPEDAEPEWPLEREVPSGKLINSAASDTQRRLAAQAKEQPAATSALAAPQQKPTLKYDPKGCPPLVQVPVTANVTVAASPDAGLATLKAFLAGTKTSLVVGMYDFTSAEILAAFEQNLAAPKTLQLVLDDPAPNPTRDQVDSVTVSDLRQALGTRANTAWALTRPDHFAAKWSFPYAYHIKVIVRDNSAVWLSSGNLNRSNEPNLSNPPSAEDRDWHVIIEDPKLAQSFAAYLDFDYRTAAANQVSNRQVTANAAAVRAIVDAHAKRARDQSAAAARDGRRGGRAQAPGHAQDRGHAVRRQDIQQYLAQGDAVAHPRPAAGQQAGPVSHQRHKPDQGRAKLDPHRAAIHRGLEGQRLALRPSAAGARRQDRRRQGSAAHRQRELRGKNTNRKASKARSRVLASIPAHQLERGSQAAPPLCAS